MGSRTFDFLTESFLFRDWLIDDGFRSVPEDELRHEVRRYREFCVAEQPALHAKIDHASTSLVAFWDGTVDAGCPQTSSLVRQSICRRGSTGRAFTRAYASNLRY